MSNKVLLGMSGGVDSSVAAILLKNKGYEVLGVTLRLKPFGDKNEDLQAKDINDAKKVCDILGIEHVVYDLRDVFKEKVIDYFVNEYINGRTPNPCVECNKNIKFGAMLDFAKSQGYKYVATGHYAFVDYDKEIGRYILRRSKSRKDQSYVLYGLSQDQLAHVIFPLSNIDKNDIRKIAEDYKLPVAKKHDSQEICFIDDDNYHRFINEIIGLKSKVGNFVDTKGNILGKHNGIENYTIGQRKGLSMSFGKPMYVISINPDNNEVTLGDNDELFSNVLIAKEVNFIPFEGLDKKMKVTAKARYNAVDSEATILPMNDNNGMIKVEFKEAQRAITPGQSVVFYNDDVVVGGGIIVR